MRRIAVVGLGQIGGSIVLTLRRKRKRYHITGIDTSHKRIRLLQQHLDHSSRRWSDAAAADLVVICLHYTETKEYLLQQKDPDQLLMDVCSGKARLLRQADRKQLRFIGGHPMAGNEFAGEKGWRQDLFENVPFFLCNSKRATKKDLAFVNRFVRNLGARPVVVDAADHDRCVALTSHFPAVVSRLLAELAENVPAVYQGSGFRSMTRLAKTPSDLMNTFLQSNGEEMVRSARKLETLLSSWIKKPQ